VQEPSDTPPPTPLPPAAQAPYPAHPAPHAASDTPSIPVAAPQPPSGLGVLGFTLIGGAVAGAIGLLIATPLLRRKAAPAKPKRRPVRRKKA
jgi:hypothetical protein